MKDRNAKGRGKGKRREIRRGKGERDMRDREGTRDMESKGERGKQV